MQLQTANLLREIDAKVASFSKMRIRFHSSYEERIIASIIRKIIDAETALIKCGYTSQCSQPDDKPGDNGLIFSAYRVTTNYYDCSEKWEVVEFKSIRALNRALMTVSHRKNGITVLYTLDHEDDRYQDSYPDND